MTPGMIGGDQLVWKDGGEWKPEEPNGGGCFNVVKEKRVLARPTVGTDIVGTKLMFFAQEIVPEADFGEVFT